MSVTDTPRTLTPFSLRRRLQLCAAMLALECFISFEEIFMLPMLKRLQVPTLLVSTPGTLSSVTGIFVIPFLGWASDRLTCCSCLGQKRFYAMLTFIVTVVGMAILGGVSFSLIFFNPDGAGTTDGYLLSASSTADPMAISHSLNNTSDFFSATQRLESSSGPYPNTSSEPNEQNSSLVSYFSTTPYQEFYNSSTLPGMNTTQDSSHDNNTSILYNTNNTTIDSRGYNSTTMDEILDSLSFLTVPGILGIVGFALADHGYDSSMATFKAYMIAVTPSSQHDDVLVMGTLVGAFGGCITSLLGFVDLSIVFNRQVDKGIAQSLIQAFIVAAKLVVLGFCSLLTGTESLPEDEDASTTDVYFDHNSATIIERGKGQTRQNDRSSGIESTSIISGDDESSEKSPLLKSNSSTIRGWLGRNKRVFLCIMTFLGLCTNYAYFVYVANYVGEVIYAGDPRAVAGSDQYQQYVDGVHIASLGMLVFYCLFVAFNLIHNKVLQKIGLRAEYLASSVLCCALTLTLALTNNIVVFFVNAFSLAVFRSAVYTIPFVLSNTYAKRDAAKTRQSRAQDNGASQTGVAMASVTAMIPASYFVVSLVMGPLMDLTGFAGAPIYFASASCFLGILSVFLVQFH